MNNTLTPITGDYVDLHSHYQTLLNKKWFILSISILTCLLCLVYTAIQPKQYQASVLLQIHPNQRSSLGTISSANPSIYKDNLSEEPISMHIALIRSKFILAPLIQSLNLDVKITPDYPLFFLKKRMPKNPFHISEFTVPWNYLNQRLYIHFDKINHYQLYTAHKKLILSGKDNEWVKNANGFSIKLDQIQALPDSQFVIVKLPEWEVMNHIRSRLQIIDLAGSSENSLNSPDILQLSFSGANAKNVVRLINQIALITQTKDRERKSLEAKKTLEFLYKQLPIIRNSLKNAETKLNQYRFIHGNLDPALQTHYLFTHLSDIDKQLEMIQIKKIALEKEYTMAHPDLIALNKTDNELQKQREEILTQIKTLTKTDEISINLVREVDVNKNLYMQLLNKIHAQQIVTAGIVSDIGILSLAMSPESSPVLSLGLISVASLFVGFILSSLGVLIWQMFTKPTLQCLDFSEKENYREKSA